MPRAPRQAPFSVQVAGVVPLSRTAAFSVAVEELREALGRLGLEFVPGAKGTVTERGTRVGEVKAWTARERVRLAWHPAPWMSDEVTEVELRFEDVPGGTKVTLEHRGGASVFGEGAEAAGWLFGGAFAPFLRSLAPAALGDWVTDRAARRPSGPRAREIYSDPEFHRPNFALLLEVLDLGPKDRLLEVGCGGGALLREALQSGCRATAVDHSPEMVRLARQNNRAAVAEGRLEVIEAEASRLPVPEDTFTSAVCTGVFGFLPHPLETLREVHRAVVTGGRFALFTGTRALVGTPACPEPMAARFRFYEDAELEELARSAGFRDAAVRRPDLTRYAVALGLPEEVVAVFRGHADGGQLLVGHKARL